MTQRKWETLDGWSVLAGWDRPLQYYFVSIDRTCRKCDGNGGFGDEPDDADQCPECDGRGSEFLFDNLSDTTGLTDPMGGMTLQQVKQVLDEKLTSYPTVVLEALAFDGNNNVGNDVSSYETQGEQRPQE